MNNDIFSGKTLKTVLEKRGRLEPMNLLYIMKSAAEELARLHQSGKIHGNIKPETVLISAQRWFCYSLPEMWTEIRLVPGQMFIVCAQLCTLH